MAGAIRNACMARGDINIDVSVTAFTVPAGYVLLCKSIFSFAATAADSRFTVYAFGATDGVYVLVADHDHASVNLVETQTWVALNGGDRLTAAAYGQPAQYWISGALLPFAPTTPPGDLELPQHPTLLDLAGPLPAIPFPPPANAT